MLPTGSRNGGSRNSRTHPGPPFPATQPATFGTIYGGTKAFLDRWTVSLAAELHGQVAVNTIAPQAAAATEVAPLDDWQPEQLPARIEKMRRHAAGGISAGPIGLQNVVNRERGGVAQ